MPGENSMFVRFYGLSLMLVAVAAFIPVACSNNDRPDAKKRLGTQAKSKQVDGKASSGTEAHGWWCSEHGVPEDMCSLCSAEAAEKLKKEGDWCKIHDRALSQCFKCDPSKYEKFEAMYMAKFNGKKPERPPESEFKN
jgi:hypothetical protein